MVCFVLHDKLLRKKRPKWKSVWIALHYIWHHNWSTKSPNIWQMLITSPWSPRWCFSVDIVKQGRSNKTSEVCQCKKRKKVTTAVIKILNLNVHRKEKRACRGYPCEHRETRTYVAQHYNTLFPSREALCCSVACDIQLSTSQIGLLRWQSKSSLCRSSKNTNKEADLRRLWRRNFEFGESESGKVPVQLYCFLLILLSLITVNKIELGKLLLAGE